MRGILHIAIIFVSLFLAKAALYGQQSVIKGYVQDKETGEPVELANVVLLETEYGASTDGHGYYFILNVPPGIYILEVNRIGYDTHFQEVYMREGESITLTFALDKKSYSLDEVAISAARVKARTQIKVSEMEVLPTDITRLPSFGSMPDIAQQLQTLPGVISPGDAGGQIYIRGGSPVQNKVLMDGAILYNPFHTSGLYSVFDPDAVRKTEVFSGGFGAEYGGSLSSVIDVTTRHGNINDYSGKVDVSTIGSKALLEGPVFRPKPGGKSNASFLAYYKTSYFDKAAQTYYSYIDRDLPFSFHDLYGKFSLFSGDVFKANLFGFSFHDQSGGNGAAFNYRWNNQGFGGNFFISPPQSLLLMQIYFAASAFNMELNEASYVPRQSAVNSVNLGIRITKYLGDHYFKYGLEVHTLKTDYLYYSTNYNQTEQSNNSSEVSGYCSYFGNYNRFLLRPGIRFILYSALNKFSLEPRLSMKYLVTDHFRLKAAGGLYTQNLISATSDRDIVNYFSGYLSAPVNIASTNGQNYTEYSLQNAWHVVAGVEMDLGDRLFINLEAYYKGYPQLINYNRDKLLNEYDHPDKPEILIKDFILEKGYSSGIETSIDYRSERMTLSLIYSIAKTERTFADKYGSENTYSPHFDRRHNVNILGTLVLSRDRSWEVNLRWNFGSGFPFTPSKGYYESITIDDLQINNIMSQNGLLDIYYGTYNAARLPAYHRLDAGIKKTFALKGNMRLEAEMNVINLYNHKNVYYVDRANNDVVYQLPFLPGFRISFAF